MKKLLTMLALVALVCVTASGLCAFGANADEALKDIDVYLIAGQSNGVGYTAVDS